MLPAQKDRMSALIDEVIRKLGGESALGRDVRSQADLALAVYRRLPLLVLKGMAQAGFTKQEIERFFIPGRTRRDRADRKQRLTIEESDRVVRLLRIQSVAEDTFVNKEKANT